jgi:superfamily II RNA helicase
VDLGARHDDPEAALDAFTSWTTGRGLRLYPAQEEALLEIFSGSHAIVTTPTGSGKSLIALGAHVAALADGRRSFYTAPIKALVSEKFFDLCAALGPERVGMMTGDGAINPRAPVICATAEVLANMVLRHGPDTPVDQVVMDEFHFYADPSRGWAWQVPLLELTNAQFVLLSATLGDTRRFEADLIRRTPRDVAVISSAVRPVPLEYEYRRTALHETVESLVAADLAPVYVVHFTQASAVAHAQALTSAQIATRAQRDAVAEAIAGFRFAPGFGQALSRLLRHAVGVHHGGMLPRYRRLVERLAQANLLRVVTGTDSLGVGVNLPLRTVVLTGLAKYDGTSTRLLSAREFHQISGRAGRAGYDTAGLAVIQAPEHIIDNERAAAKVGNDPKKTRKLVKAKPPRGFVPWTEETFDRLVAAPPEPLVSSFTVTHSMLLNVLDRPGNGALALRRLLLDNDEPRPAKRRHIRTAIAMYRSLLAAGALEVLDEPDERGRRIRVTTDLQSDFALDAPLGPFVLDALDRLDPASPTWPLDVLSVIEATLDSPGPILAAQLDKLRGETVSRLKSEGVEYEERMAVLDTLEHPKPLADMLYELFDSYRLRHAWAADHNVRPKSVARDLYERAMTFSEYVAHYGLTRSEGLVLRYLSDVYKTLRRSVPEDLKTDELHDLTAWLGEVVRQIDSSLLDEWEALSQKPTGDRESAEIRPPTAAEDGAAPPLSANERAFTVMLRNAAFRRVELAARHDHAGLAALEGPGGWDSATWTAALAPYRAEHDSIGTGADARSGAWFGVEREPAPDGAEKGAGWWRIRQVLDDPDGDHEWAMVFNVDIEASDALGEPVMIAADVGRHLGAQPSA